MWAWTSVSFLVWNMPWFGLDLLTSSGGVHSLHDTGQLSSMKALFFRHSPFLAQSSQLGSLSRHDNEADVSQCTSEINKYICMHGCMHWCTACRYRIWMIRTVSDQIFKLDRYTVLIRAIPARGNAKRTMAKIYLPLVLPSLKVMKASSRPSSESSTQLQLDINTIKNVKNSEDMWRLIWKFVSVFRNTNRYCFLYLH